ncbi:MAG: hypothetical protein AB8B99_18885 [Phormidesmis sp.]
MTEEDLKVNFRLTWIYMDSETKERFQAASDLGWAYKSLVQQCLGAFFTVHRNFYAIAAKADWEARGMEQTAYYDALQAGDKLPEYKGEKPDWSRLKKADGEFYQVPLSTVASPATDKENGQRYNSVTTSRANYASLMVAQIVHGVPLTTLVSIIVKEHFAKYWDRTYQTQIKMHREKRFTLKED